MELHQEMDMLWSVIICDCCRAHLWQHFLKVMLEMSLLTLLVHNALTLAFPVIMRQVLIMERCVYVCVCVCVCVSVSE